MSDAPAVRAITPEQDTVNAFCHHLPPVSMAGSGAGPLAGTTFAIKDLYTVAGHRNAFGNPDWLESHEPAPRTAPVIEQLLAAGADLIGKTHTDELAFSLNGENHWYGTPTNVNAPGRIPGGSSNGSAAAVAAGLVDFALGSDTGGSVRCPASYCNLFGLRTSHGAIPLDGVLPLASGFDTIGWFTRDLDLYARVAKVLLPDPGKQAIERLVIWENAFDQVAPELRQQALTRCEQSGLPVDFLRVDDVPIDAWGAAFRALQVRDAHVEHLDWLTAVNPSFGPGIKDRFDWVRNCDPDGQEVADAERMRTSIVEQTAAWFDGSAALVLPSAAGAAPKPSVELTAMDEFRRQTMRLTILAGLLGAPQLSLPLLNSADSLPVGLSILGLPGQDLDLIDVARRIVA